MNRQVLIITSSISPQDRDLIQERLADLEPESVMESEIARRLRDMIDTGAVQVADRANLTDTDVRKIEIMVDAGQVNDDQAFWLAKDVSKRIESEMQYPGQIKVTVMRETRAVEFAR